MSENEEYYVVWYSIDSKATVSRDLVLGLRMVHPKARVPSKTLPDGTLSNLNVRAALRDLVEGTLEGVKLTGGTYFLKVAPETVIELRDRFLWIGCDVGVIEIHSEDLAIPTSSYSTTHTQETIEFEIAKKHSAELQQLMSLLDKYNSKPTAHRGMAVIEKLKEIRKFRAKYDFIELWLDISEEAEQQIKELEELYEL